MTQDEVIVAMLVGSLGSVVLGYAIIFIIVKCLLHREKRKIMKEFNLTSEEFEAEVSKYRRLYK